MTKFATTDQITGYIPIAKNVIGKSAGKCKHVIVQLIIPQSKKYYVLSVNLYKEKLSPHIHKKSSRISDEVIKIHNKQDWFKRCSTTLIDNAAGLGMAMLAGNIVQNQFEVREFGNLWGLLATRPVVSEATYEVLSFSAEFIIALIVFTLTEHFLDERRQKKSVEALSLSEGKEDKPHLDMPKVKAAK